MPAVPPPSVTYPSAVGGRRKAVPLDGDSPKPLPDVLTWRRLDKEGGQGAVQAFRFCAGIPKAASDQPSGWSPQQGHKGGSDTVVQASRRQGADLPLLPPPLQMVCFWGSRQQPSPRCAVSVFAIENDPFSRQGGGASRPTSSHDLPKCSGRQEKGDAAR